MVKAVLRIKNGPQQGREYRIGITPATIGRKAHNDIILDDKSISGGHAAIFPDGAGYVIRDLGSRNGTKINGIPVTESDLKDGDVILLGAVKVEFAVLTEAGTRAEPPPPSRGEAPAGATGPRAGSPCHGETPAGATGLHGGETGQQTVEASVAGGGGPQVAPVSDVSSPERVCEVHVEPEVTEVYRERDTGEKRRPRRMPLVILILLIPLLIVGLKMLLSSHEVLRSYDMVMVGESKMVEVRPPYAGTPRVSDPDIVRCETVEEDFLLVVTGLAEGSATISMTNLSGVPMELKVIVRGMVVPEIDPYELRPLSAEQRVRLASSFNQEGEQILKTGPYEAWKLFLHAKKILAPLPLKPKEYFEAERRATEAEEIIRQRFESLRFSVRQAFSMGDNLRARAELARILELIPDSSDLRHQKAQIYLRVVSQK